MQSIRGVDRTRTADPLVANSGHEGRPGVSAHGSGRSKPRKPCRSHGRCCTSLLYCSLGTVRSQPSAVDTLSQQTDDLFITRELHTPRALHWPALSSAVSTKGTPEGQPDQIEVMYDQNAPTPMPLVVWMCRKRMTTEGREWQRVNPFTRMACGATCGPPCRRAFQLFISSTFTSPRSLWGWPRPSSPV
jgi:hypothetical protein